MIEEVTSGDERIKRLLKEKHDLEEANKADSMRYGDILHELETAGIYELENKAERILSGLGFKDEDIYKPINHLSGGWQMRVELAKILMQNNDLLLLDEPTNHLDIESILWLEQFLSDSSQAVILVSHDRTFLNNATTRTIEIVLGKSYDFPCPYYRYLSLRAEIREKQRQAKANQDKEIKATEQLIERFRYKASKASFAQSLIKKLDKVDIIEVDDEDTRSMRFKFPPAPHSGKVVVRMEGIHKHYDEKHVLRGLDLELVRGQKVAFVGQNGQGKSTLVKILAENLKHEGSLEWGHQVQLGYYAQNQAEALDGSKTVLATIEEAAPEELRKSARKLLGNFMFAGDDVEKKVSVLSGGERGRLALCQLMLNPINLLILDEPTNHLDMQAKDVLKQSLESYEGTLVVVSHDREFLHGLANMTYEFKEGKIKQYLGGIEYFLEQRKMQSMREVELQQDVKKQLKADAAAKNLKDAKAPKATREAVKVVEKDLRSAEREEKKAQELFEKAHAALDAVDQLMANPVEFKKVSSEPDFYARYEALQKESERTFGLWEKASAELERCQKAWEAIAP